MLTSLKQAAELAGYSYEVVWRNYKAGKLGGIVQEVGPLKAADPDDLKAKMQELGVKTRAKHPRKPYQRKAHTGQEEDPP